eukprot:m.173301 g.173301  ORF g.173301 m.173301 type:complete len:149 (+) comp15385_c2_seq4:127-573(+)
MSLFRLATRTITSQHQALAAAVTRSNASIKFLSEETSSRINKMVNEDKLVVFMKGTPHEPMCGYSKAVVTLLDMHGVDLDKLKAHNVLEDPDIREGIKEYSEWPTIPQVYLDGEFAGGCDIMISMHQSGELEDALEKIGHKSTFSDEE